jgi:hypothetical protein
VDYFAAIRAPRVRAYVRFQQGDSWAQYFRSGAS